MRKACSPSPFPEARALLGLFLCIVLVTGCGGVRPDAGAGVFGPSWQAREATYLQEAEENDDLEERMKAADRKAWGKTVLYLLLLAVGVAALAESSDDEEVAFDTRVEIRGIAAGAGQARSRGGGPK